ncbi:MAG: ddpC [Firmicutes bacterium]|nr:ddpC [Bacillota bacterium]
MTLATLFDAVTGAKRQPIAVREPSRRGGIAPLVRSRLALTGGAMLLLVLLAALLAPLLARYDPMAVMAADRLLSPSMAHPFGTDDFGRDIFSRVLYGARLSLAVGFLVVLFTTLAGAMIGLVAGYYRIWDNVLMRLMDGIMAFPAVLLATAIMAALGPRVSNVVIALAAAYMPRLARVVRAQVLVLREMAYVEAAVAQGAPDRLVLVRHILPNCLSPVIVQATVTFAYAVLTEAALSFLGVGAPPDIPSWGNILSDGRNFLTQAPWMTLFPGVAIMVTVLGLNLFGDGLRDALDPHSGEGIRRKG